jgi:hypothetical protein
LLRVSSICNGSGVEVLSISDFSAWRKLFYLDRVWLEAQLDCIN